MDKELLGLIATAIAVYSYCPYLAGILTGRTKPHVFSWFLWGLLMGIACVAQVSEGAGPGAWVTGYFSLSSFLIATLALKRGDRDITRLDKATFLLALMAIPLWLATDDPLWSVILVTGIDMLAFFPTFRKSWRRPQEEIAQTYILSMVALGVSILALDVANLVTALYPAALVVMNGLLGALILMRRNKPENKG